MTASPDTTGAAQAVDLQPLFDAMSRAWADGDADAFVRHYTPDATAILPGFRLEGRESIRSSMSHAFQGPLGGTRRVHEIRDIRAVGTSAVIVVTASATLIADESVAPADRREWATWLVVHDGSDDWHVKAYHGSPATLA